MTYTPKVFCIRKTRTYQSLHNIQAAVLFSKKCRDIERCSNSNADLRDEHRSYAISSIIMVAAFLEATINELFSDCSEDILSDGQKNLKHKDTMKTLWLHGVPRRANFPILAKYNKALEVNLKPEFSEKEDIHKSIKLITDLRNAIVHFEPKSSLSHADLLNSKNPLDKLEKAFIDKKITLNKLTTEGNTFFPDRLLGYGCSHWAISNAIAFTDEFFNRLEITPTYAHIKDKLCLGTL